MVYNQNVYFPTFRIMRHTTIPSIKGQITIPAEIRAKYHISQETPLTIEDKGKGVITVRVMRLVEHDAIEFYENDQEFGLTFKNGIDTKVITDLIKKSNG